jgi:hypothetical protein
LNFRECSRHPGAAAVTFYRIEPRMEAGSARKDVIKRFWNIGIEYSAIAGAEYPP